MVDGDGNRMDSANDHLQHTLAHYSRSKPGTSFTCLVCVWGLSSRALSGFPAEALVSSAGVSGRVYWTGKISSFPICVVLSDLFSRESPVA